MANANIGHVKCPLAGELCVVRADKRGKLYYFSPFGKITPNLPEGQRWLSSISVMWPNGEQPENITINEMYRGAPPTVTVNASKPTEKPLTPSPEEIPNESPPKRRGFLDSIFGEDDDE